MDIFSLFEYIDYEPIEFNQKSPSPDGAPTTTATLPRLEFLDRDNVAQVVALRERTPRRDGRVLLVANTHILFNQGRGDIKLGQLLLLLATIESMRAQHGANGVLLAGDFNSTPTSQFFSFVRVVPVDMRPKCACIVLTFVCWIDRTGLPRHEGRRHVPAVGPESQAQVLVDDDGARVLGVGIDVAIKRRAAPLEEAPVARTIRRPGVWATSISRKRCL